MRWSNSSRGRRQRCRLSSSHSSRVESNGSEEHLQEQQAQVEKKQVETQRQPAGGPVAPRRVRARTARKEADGIAFPCALPFLSTTLTTYLTPITYGADSSP